MKTGATRRWPLAWIWLGTVAACLFICTWFAAADEPAAVAPMTYIYPAPESPEDVRYLDLVALLKGALDHTTKEYGPYQLQATALPMTEARQLMELGKRGNGPRQITVVWSSTSEEKERDLRPILIPLRKGLLGYRICLIRAEHQAEIDRINTLEDLRHYTVGQGIGWGDIDVYNANEIRVLTALYKQLFGMTDAGRFELFPRGINEVFDEFEENRKTNPHLAIEQHLLLYYPWPYYFFFNRADVQASTRVEKGLWLMIQDGSFEASFQRFHGEAIKRANLAGRRVIRLNNPLLPTDTPLNNPILWYEPAGS